MITHTGRSQRDEPPQRRRMLGLRIQLTDEEDLLEIRLCFKQLPLDVADALLAHPQHTTRDRGLLEKGPAHA